LKRATQVKHRDPAEALALTAAPAYIEALAGSCLGRCDRAREVSEPPWQQRASGDEDGVQHLQRLQLPPLTTRHNLDQPPLAVPALPEVSGAATWADWATAAPTGGDSFLGNGQGGNGSEHSRLLSPLLSLRDSTEQHIGACLRSSFVG
jgi:hypothetical protein